MSISIALLTGLLAFIGVVLGHFVSSDLNALHKRREVRRAQLERLGEYISEDRTWMDSYRREMLYRGGDSPSEPSPFDRARAIYHLYFYDELKGSMSLLIEKRREFDLAIDRGHLERLDAATKSGQPVTGVAPSKAAQDEVFKHFDPYYKAFLNALTEISKLIKTTMPEELETVSPLKRLRAWLRV